MKVVLLNGPPRSGKDTIGAALAAQNRNARVFKFATQLKNMTHRLFGLHAVLPEAYESRKDKPLPVFMGLTPRNAYIAVSERLMKPVLGEDVFGKLLLHEIERLASDKEGIAVVTDSGFAAEAQVLIDAFGRDNILLVHVHRQGTSFANDSRGYIDLDIPMRNKIIINNNVRLTDILALANTILAHLEEM